MKRKWTRGEKWLWATPLLIGIFAVGSMWGPQVARHALGLPQVLATTPDASIRSIAISANGAVLAASGEIDGKTGLLPGSGTVNLWDARTGEQLASIAPVYQRDNNGLLNGLVVYGLALSPDGERVGFARTIENWTLYDVATNQPLWSLTSCASDARFSPDGKWIALSFETSVWIVNASDGRARARWYRKAAPYSSDLCWSRDGKWVANIGAYKDGSLEIHRADNGELVRRIEFAHRMEGETTNSIEFSPDGAYLLSASAVTTFSPNDKVRDFVALRCHDVATGRIIWQVKAADLAGTVNDNLAFCDAIFSPDGRVVAAYQPQTGRLLLLDSATGEVASTRHLDRTDNPTSFVPPALLFSPDGKRLFVRAGNVVLAFDLE